MRLARPEGRLDCLPISEVKLNLERRDEISPILRALAEVRIAAGHTNLAVTSIYLHVAVDDDDGVGDLFGAR